MTTVQGRNGSGGADGRSEPRSRPKGRPPLERDFVAIRDRRNELDGVPGAVSQVAREFDASRGWLYKHGLA